MLFIIQSDSGATLKESLNYFGPIPRQGDRFRIDGKPFVAITLTWHWEDADTHPVAVTVVVKPF